LTFWPVSGVIAHTLREGKTKLKGRKILDFWAMAAVLVAALCSILPVAVQGQYINSNMSVLDINFDADTVGATPTTYNGGAMGPPFPAVYPQAYGAFVNLFTGGPLIFTETNGVTFRVDNVAGMTKAVVMSNAWAGTSATDTTVSFLDHNFSVPTSARARLELDFSQLQTPAGTNAGFRSDWLIVAFKVNSNPQQVAWAIGTRHGFPGQIFLQQTAPNNLPIGTYTNGVPTHIELISYHEGGGRFDVYLNGQLAAKDVPFNNPMANDNDQVKELFVQLVGAENSSNVVAYDNFQYTLLIPEPTAITLAGLVAALVFWRGRWRRI